MSFPSEKIRKLIKLIEPLGTDIHSGAEDRLSPKNILKNYTAQTHNYVWIFNILSHRQIRSKKNPATLRND